MKIKKKFGDCEEDKQTTIRKNKQETTEMKEKQKWKTMKTRMRQKTTKKKKRRSKQSFSAVYLPERTNEEVLKDTSYFFIQLLIFFSFFVCRYTIYQHIFSNSDSSFHSHACLYIACFVILRILLMMKIQRKKKRLPWKRSTDVTSYCIGMECETWRARPQIHVASVRVTTSSDLIAGRNSIKAEYYLKRNL